MHLFSKIKTLIICIALICAANIPVLSQGSVPDAQEIQALRDLYESTNGANWTDHTNWPVDAAAWDAISNVDQIVGWFGITVIGGDVQRIVMPNNNLTGTLPTNLNNLSQLVRFEVQQNNIGGNLPASLGSLPNLKNLFLGQNAFTGTIPSELGSLPNVEFLYLNNNQLTGAIPTELGSLSTLNILYLPGNLLSGSIPASLGGLINLTQLRVQENQLTGTIPVEIGSITSLQHINLNDNQLSGDLPTTLTDLDNLTILNLHNNGFTSFPDFNIHVAPANINVNIQNNAIPQTFIDANIVSGTTIFSSFTYDPQNATNGLVPDLVEIQALRDLYENNGGANWNNNTNWPANATAWDAVSTVDQIVDWHGVTVTNGDVTQILLSGNNLQGDFPNLSSLTGLLHLNVQTNNFNPGPIPDWIGSLTKLTHLRILATNRNGTIPDGIRSLTQLASIQIKDNAIDGPLPNWIGELTGLYELRIENNNLSGPIPTSVGDLINLVNLTMANNNFDPGPIPDYIQYMSKLKYIRMSPNRTGPVPDWLGNLVNLELVYLHNNQGLEGGLPSSLSNLTKLKTLWIDNAGLVGPVPDLSQSPDLVSLWLNNNNLTSFPDFHAHPSPQNIDVKIQTNYIPQADIDANFDGTNHIFASFTYQPQQVPNGQVPDTQEIQALRDFYENTNGTNWTNNTNWPADAAAWDAITSVDQIVGWFGVTTGAGDVTRLDLQNNNLVGTLPESLGSLTQLTRLYLETNSLSGTLPTSLGNLIGMQYLWLGANDLQSPLPASMGNLTELIQFRIRQNNFNEPLPNWIAGFNQLTYFDVQQNQFSGAIPDWLGSLTQLNYLNLGLNQFTGPLPQSFDQLVNMSNLQLRDSDIGGTFPTQLQSMPTSGILVCKTLKCPAPYRLG